MCRSVVPSVSEDAEQVDRAYSRSFTLQVTCGCRSDDAHATQQQLNELTWTSLRNVRQTRWEKTSNREQQLTLCAVLHLLA